MRKLLVLIGALAALAVTGAAAAKTVTVTITKNGYVPQAVTIAVSDSVQFTNTDAVAHQVVLKKTSGSPARRTRSSRSRLKAARAPSGTPARSPTPIQT